MTRPGLLPTIRRMGEARHRLPAETGACRAQPISNVRAMGYARSSVGFLGRVARATPILRAGIGVLFTMRRMGEARHRLPAKTGAGRAQPISNVRAMGYARSSVGFLGRVARASPILRAGISVLFTMRRMGEARHRLPAKTGARRAQPISNVRAMGYARFSVGFLGRVARASPILRAGIGVLSTMRRMGEARHRLPAKTGACRAQPIGNVRAMGCARSSARFLRHASRATPILRAVHHQRPMRAHARHHAGRAG